MKHSVGATVAALFAGLAICLAVLTGCGGDPAWVDKPHHEPHRQTLSRIDAAWDKMDSFQKRQICSALDQISDKRAAQLMHDSPEQAGAPDSDTIDWDYVVDVFNAKCEARP